MSFPLSSNNIFLFVEQKTWITNSLRLDDGFTIGLEILPA
jgi:hypothetical protein